MPLSPQAIKVIEGQSEGKYLFSGGKGGAPLSNMAMLELLKRMGRDDLTVHGFRSTFRDWAAECTSYPSEVCEMALAHAISDKVEAAYRRGDLFEKRRQLMVGRSIATRPRLRFCRSRGNGRRPPSWKRLLCPSPTVTPANTGARRLGMRYN